MAEKIIIKREWNNSAIKVGFNADEVYIEADVDAFADRLVTVMLEKVDVKALRWAFAKGTIHDEVKKAIVQAWATVTTEMKEETRKVV